MTLQVAPFADGLQIAYRDDTIDAWVMQSGFATGDWSRYDYQPEPDHVILDAGAHIGTFALRAATRVPEGRVFAIEASRGTYDVLAHNVRLNGMEHLQADHLALSDQAGTVRLHHSEHNWGHTITKAVSDDGELVPATSLSAYLADNEIDRCHFAKFNCEGAEFPALMATEVSDLRKFDNMLVLYHLDLVDEDVYGLEELERHLGAAGFELRRGTRSPTRGRIIARRAD